MGYRAALLNFSKGEIAPELEARFDLPAYQAGLRKAENVVIRRTGGVIKRMGTRYVATCLGTSSRLIPFQFSDDQAYMLEFAQGEMRPFALGGAVLEEALKVTAITNDVHPQVTAAYHGYEVGDQVYFTGIGGMTEINDRFITILQVIDDNNFRINVDSTSWGVFDNSDTGTERVVPPAAPPAPPAIPTPITPATPPTVGSGSGGGYDDSGDWYGYDPYTRTYL
jgi:hypothetical protein